MRELLGLLTAAYMGFAMWYLFPNQIAYVFEASRRVFALLKADFFSALAALEMAQLARLLR